ncbi:MAG: siroheme synthase CysG [Geminicoccaceae bacterium]
MQHFPIFVDLREQSVVVSGAGETAIAKLRLLLKTEADVTLFGEAPHEQIRVWADAGLLRLVERRIEAGDAEGARLLYAANDDAIEDAHAAAIGRTAGALVNVVDNLEHSQFITPAIVDRDPVTVAIGTEGAAPVLARRIKAETEERLSADIGKLASIAKTFRPMAEALPSGRVRRQFWSRYYNDTGPNALRQGGVEAVHAALRALLAETLQMRPEPGRVAIIGAGPGNPELLTLKARRQLHEADVVIHDRLVASEILEIARREALLISVGKMPGGPSWTQDDINALMIEHAGSGAHVARLKSGDPTIYGRLDEEMDALDAAGIAFEVVPGITSAAAAAASINTSLTKRRRNSSLRILTGQDVDGFAEQDWRGLARPGATACIYMGVRASRFLQGRLMIHGAHLDTPMTVVENASRVDETIVAATLATLPEAIAAAGIRGPAIIFLGLTPRSGAGMLDQLNTQAVGGR